MTSVGWLAKFRMYLWQIEKLKSALRDDRFGDREVIPYILVFIGLYAFAIELIRLFYPYGSSNKWDYPSAFLNITAPIVGTYLAYRANGGQLGRSFAAKYFSISFVVTIRLCAFLLPVFIALASLIAITNADEPIPVTPQEIGLELGFYALFYWRVIVHIKDTLTLPERQLSVGNS